MSLPKDCQAWRRTTGKTPVTLERVTEKLPSTLKPKEVLIRIHAVSLNYRDVAMLNGTYPASVIERGIPGSDCAAEVVAIGSSVKIFKIGDHVAPTFDLINLKGTESEMACLGGDVDGVLRRYAIYDEEVLYRLPSNLSWEEVCRVYKPTGMIDPNTNIAFATNRFPLSRVLELLRGTVLIYQTQWTVAKSPSYKVVSPRSSMLSSFVKLNLCSGTGGVSMFALLLCLAAGIHPIITSSSDEKLKFALKQGPEGAIDGINYVSHPKWEEEARRLTNGQGVDIVVENAGQTTIAQSLDSIRRRGLVSMVGFLGGASSGQVPDLFYGVLMKSATLR
ncbi:hypothetical protein H2198_003736 [Neophaeococcomyces mojaviensis]|uniref:Uncharacterized protein n=1 Tax=Neophaeococcomyces mojaviensis TaxID=3383035 RepID=A0ACC3AB50_9EURO|nr:hypothetical protein H2198_003736 [Knufia sp. JES_112]